MNRPFHCPGHRDVRALPQFANARTSTGAVRGQITDSQSQAVVGVHARAHSTRTTDSFVRTQLTGGSAEFTFVGIPLTIEDVAAAVDSTFEVRLRLHVLQSHATTRASSVKLTLRRPTGAVFESNPETRAGELVAQRLSLTCGPPPPNSVMLCMAFVWHLGLPGDSIPAL